MLLSVLSTVLSFPRRLSFVTRATINGCVWCAVVRLTIVLLRSPRQALSDDGVVAPPSLPGGVSTSVGGDALPDAVVASGEVSALPDGSGATGSAPEGSTAEVVIPVSPGVDTESPDGPGSVCAAPDVSVSASPAAVAAGLDATSGTSVAEAPAPGGGSAPEVSNDYAVPPASGVSGAGDGVELPGGTAVLPEVVAGENAKEPCASPVGESCCLNRRTLLMGFDFLFAPRYRERE